MEKKAVLCFAHNDAYSFSVQIAQFFAISSHLPHLLFNFFVFSKRYFTNEK